MQPGGRLIIGTPDYGGLVWPALEWFYGKLAPGGYAEEHISPYTRNELFSLMRRRGLTLEEYHYILRGELIAAFRRPEAEA